MDGSFDKIKHSFYKLVLNEKVKEASCNFKSSINILLEHLSRLKRVNNDLISLFKQSIGYFMNWVYDQSANSIEKIKILGLEYVLRSWEGDPFFREKSLRQSIKSSLSRKLISEKASSRNLYGEKGNQWMYFDTYGEDEPSDLMILFGGYTARCLRYVSPCIGKSIFRCICTSMKAIQL